jgi:hypothetical protein
VRTGETVSNNYTGETLTMLVPNFRPVGLVTLSGAPLAQAARASACKGFCATGDRRCMYRLQVTG